MIGYTGNRQTGIAGRFGDAAGDKGHLRLYAKHDYCDSEPTVAGNPQDEDVFSGARFDFRGDRDATPADAPKVQGELFRADADGPLLNGGSLALQWAHARESGAADILRIYYDRAELETGSGVEAVYEDLYTLDIELRHRFAPLGRHDLLAGVGYRWYRSDIDGNALHFANPGERSFKLASAFVQDEIRLVRDRWYVTLGTKLEHNDFTGWEVQPSVRTRWHPQPTATLWAALSRAVRTPSRGESDLVLESHAPADHPAAGGLPVVLRSAANKDLDSESLVAYELGYRWRPRPQCGLDLAAYYNDYSSLRTIEIGSPALSLDPYPLLVIPTIPDNAIEGPTYGFDLIADWRPSARWRLQGWYSRIRIDLRPDADSTDPEAVLAGERFPEQQAGVRIGVGVPRRTELGLFWRYVDRLGDEVDAYTELDARIGWRASRGVNLALVGRNLLHPMHQEYTDEILGSTPHEIAHQVFVRAELRF